MKTANPFQIPSCLQRDLQQRRRKRLQQIVLVSVAATSAFLVVLLVEGCMTEHTKAASGTPTTVAAAPPAQASTVAAAEPTPALTLPMIPAAPTPVALVAVKKTAPPVSPATESLYVVKPGDTLIRIAKLYRTTVKALKAVNGLNGDTIGVRTKLKLPIA